MNKFLVGGLVAAGVAAVIGYCNDDSVVTTVSKYSEHSCYISEEALKSPEVIKKMNKVLEVYQNDFIVDTSSDSVTTYTLLLKDDCKIVFVKHEDGHYSYYWIVPTATEIFMTCPSPDETRFIGKLVKAINAYLPE